MSSIIGIIGSFTVIFVLVFYKVNIGLSLIVGSIVLGLFVLPVTQVFLVIFQTSTAISTLDLILTLASITFLNFAYQSTGKSRELVESLGKLVPSAILVGVLPIIFGILPVSGGALFSAPLVDLEGEKLGINREKKVFLNIWFRHIPHLVYPLETALVIASYISGVDLLTMILYQVPIFIIGMIIGYIIGLRGIGKTNDVNGEWQDIQDFLVNFSPILMTVILAFCGVKVYFAVVIGVIFLLGISGFKGTKLLSNVREVSKMALVALGIMVFRTVFEESGAIDITTQLVQSGNFWPPIWLVALSFLIGFVIGESSPSTTITLSVLSGLTFSPPAATLAFTCTYLGHLISPLHLCFAVTSEFFKTRLSQMYRRLLPATLLTLLIESILMVLLL